MKVLAWLLLCVVFLGLISPVRGADATIRKTQAILQTRGFYHGQIDGIPGSQTAAAIRRYQLANKLRVTGKLNPQTLRHLGLTDPVPTPPVSGSLLTSREQAARQKLKSMGYSVGSVAKYHAALRAWQKSSRLPVSGQLDKRSAKGLGLTP